MICALAFPASAASDLLCGASPTIEFCQFKLGFNVLDKD